MSRIYVAAGSNLGNRLEHLEKAFEFLVQQGTLQAIRQSPIYETDPVGGPKDQGAFLNAVWVFETSADPQSVLKILQAAEWAQGRVRAEKNGPRVIDLDLAAYEEILYNQGALSLPHERMHERWFVLQPLCDVEPQWRHPFFHKTASELLSGLPSVSRGILFKAGAV